MLDIKFIRENKDIVAAGAKKKHIDIDIDRLLVVDDMRKELQQKIDDKRAEQNIASTAIVSAKTPEEKQAVIERMAEVKETLKIAEESLAEVMKEWRDLMVRVPNVPDMSVPDGDSDADNMEWKTWGEPTKFDFTPKSHVDLLLDNDMVDYERGTKVAGFRGYFLKGDGALLMWALERFVIERFMKKDFTPLVVPSIGTIQAMAIDPKRSIGALTSGEPVEVSFLEDSKTLATFDAVGDLAGRDAQKLAALLEDVGRGAEEGTEELLAALRGGEVGAVDEGKAFGALPDGEKPGFQKITLVASDAHIAAIREACAVVIDDGRAANVSSAVGVICEAFLAHG